MQGLSNQQGHHSLVSEILAAYGLLTHGHGGQAGEALTRTIRHMCEVVERSEDGWLAVYGECFEAANVEPHAVALLAAQAAVELVTSGYLTEEPW